MTNKLWKVSTFICAGLLATTVAWNRVPSARADDSDQPIAMDNCEDQGHMEAALEHLRVARHELHEAGHFKGEHRVKAMEATQSAINQVKKGCRFADDRRDIE
ncbi:MAG TPA: hypothetical protein VGF94_23055 [Kofleriaceae bacterium]|jgi:hypothetical protein